MSKKGLKSLLSFVGKILGLSGLLFVLYKLSQEYTLDSFLTQFAHLYNILPLLFILNILSTLLGIYAWHMMLRNYAKISFGYKTSYYYFAKTEIAKYLPGNIFHFVGRQAFASHIGITQKEMAKISILFSLLLLTATVISSTFFAFLSTGIPAYILTLMGLSCMIIGIFIFYTYPSFPLKEKVYMNLLLSVSVALQGIMLGMIIAVLSDHLDPGIFFECVSIYIISWLIGFVTPGASGGLGIREGIFVAISTFLHVNIATDIIVFAVLFVRLINVLIDVGMYVSTWIQENKRKGMEE